VRRQRVTCGIDKQRLQIVYIYIKHWTWVTQGIRILTRVGDKSFIILGIHAVGEQRLNLLVIQVLTFKRGDIKIK